MLGGFVDSELFLSLRRLPHSRTLRIYRYSIVISKSPLVSSSCPDLSISNQIYKVRGADILTYYSYIVANDTDCFF